MTIVVTGASGQYGRLVADGLLREVAPSDLILVTRSPDSLADYSRLGCTVRYGDYDAPETLADAVRGGEQMLLVSGTRVGRRVAQHGAAIDAAVAAGVRRIVYTSFIGAGDPANHSEAVADHRGTEALLRAAPVAWTFLRNAQYADAVTDVMAPIALASGAMLSVAGDGEMGFVWRADCAACAVAALLTDGHTACAYDITGPDLVSYREVARLIEHHAGRPIRFEQTDEAGLYAMFDALGVPRAPVDGLVVGGTPWNSDDMVSFEAAVRDGRFAVRSDDVERLTGRAPRSLAALFAAKAHELTALAAFERAPTTMERS
ncbi:NAD(P)H-binding protein [Sphingomonas hankookensis]|uniref:NAD(P)-dependent oxidoreductase n=1 Tax=Sphingomonas hengshuiensis TaxID=1609977 RepID=A0A2W4ZDA2_9SPHN|nr:MAG: NAD(P)-dependent oxidoreductase [Sphingomonas hengshuiensis]